MTYLYLLSIVSLGFNTYTILYLMVLRRNGSIYDLFINNEIPVYDDR